MRNRILQGDCLTVLKTLPDNLVDCVVTSPPYWGLRDYQVEGQLGLEKTPQEYISRMVEVFREVRRVMKPEASLWLNIGDSYAGSGSPGGDFRDGKGGDEYLRPYNRKGNGLKPKDLCGIPWILAFALRDDGWWLRQDIIWSKPNPMPESVTDRCTKSHEYLFLLTKSARYYWDQEAVREGSQASEESLKRAEYGRYYRDDGIAKRNNRTGKPDYLQLAGNDYGYSGNGRNIRSVWNIATQPFPQAHFATFPEALVEPCIKAGTSEKGYCPECGKPWVRQIEKKTVVMPEKTLSGWQRGPGSHDKIPKGRYYGEEYSGKCSDLKPQEASRRMLLNVKARRDSGEEHDNPFPPSKTLGWQPSCSCGRDSVPGLVLDPFSGAGTVAVVAKRLLRDYIGIELNPEYITMSEKRLAMTPAQGRLF